MTRKPLPKAITRPIANLRNTAAALAPDEEAPALSRAPSSDAAKSSAKSSTTSSATPFDAVEAEPALAISAVAVANDPFPAGAAPDHARVRAFAAKRRALAGKIVQRHRTYAALSGLSPLPVFNIAGVTAIILRMVKQLSEIYQVPFQRDRTRAMIVGLVGGAVPTGVGAATASTLAFVAPGGALVGLGVCALTAGALTKGIGQVFIESFESGSIDRGGAPKAT